MSTNKEKNYKLKLKKYPNGGKTPVKPNTSNYVVTTDDSTEVYNNAVAVENYYNNLVKKGIYKKPTKDYSTKAEYYDMDMVKKESIRTYKQEWEQYKKNGIHSLAYQEYIRQNKGKTTKDYEKSLLNSINDTLKGGKNGKYYYKDLLPSNIDTEAPSTLYHKGMKPDGKIHYDWVNKESSEITHDYSNYPTGGSMTETFFYDKNRIKPYHLRTAKEKEILHEKYRKENGIQDNPQVQPIVYQKPKPKDTAPIVKKEVTTQPVVTKPVIQTPVVEPTKTVPKFRAQYNMPDTSASPNMQGEYPLKMFYQGTNTKQEADSIEDVKGLERIKLQEYMRNNPKKKKYAPGGTVSIATTLAPMAIASAERNYGEIRDKIGANNTIQASDMTDYSQFLDPMTMNTINSLPDFAKRDPRYKSQIDTQAKTSYVNQQPITRVDTGSDFIFPNGGIMPSAPAELEKQEVYQTPDGTVGNVDGPSHSNGGVDINLPEGTRIWSDRLKSGNKTFAQKAKAITNKISRLEKLPNRKYDRTIDNTLNIFNGQLDNLFVEQETMKQVMGVDDSGNTFSQGGYTKYPGDGTFDPFEDLITYQDQDIASPSDPVDNSNFRFYEYDKTGKNQYSVPPLDDQDRVYDPIPGQTPNNFPQRNNAINLLEDEPAKPLNMKRSNGLEMPKVSVNERDVLPYIGPTNQFISSFQKDPVNRIRNKMAGPAMADLLSAEQMLPTRYDITPQLGEAKSADRSFRKAVGERTTGSNTSAILNANKANNLRLKANLYGEKFNKENSMDMARAEVRSNIGRFRASLGSEDANYERQYDIDRLQNKAGQRTMRNSAISNLASNKMQNTNDKMKISLLKQIFPNADLSEALKSLELFNTRVQYE